MTSRDIDPRLPKRSLEAQIAAVERELDMRWRVYPQLVRTRKMSQGEADEHIVIMRNVLETLWQCLEERQRERTDRSTRHEPVT